MTNREKSIYYYVIRVNDYWYPVCDYDGKTYPQGFYKLYQKAIDKAYKSSISMKNLFQDENTSINISKGIDR